MISERIKFYADTPKGEKNKQFCFNTNILSLADSVKRFFLQGFNIKAAWYEKIETDTGEIIENTRIPKSTLQELFDQAIEQSKKDKSKVHTNKHNFY